MYSPHESEGHNVTDSALRELADDPSSRKRFFKMMGGAGAVSAFGVFLAACGDDKKDAATTSSTAEPASADDGMKEDLAVLNYALTLEFLEARFYKQVIASGIVKDPKVGAIATKFGETEQEHVDALKATITKLGGTPVKAPATVFEKTLEKGLMAVLNAAADVENLGAAAYLGAAGRITNKEVLAAALSIHSVEARHAAALNQLLGRGFGGKGGLKGTLPDGAFGKGMDEASVLAAVKPFLA